MKKLLALAAVVGLLATGCADSKTLEGRTYPTYGFFNRHEAKSSKVCYRTSIGSVVVGVIFVETIIAPVYIFGFDLYEPVRMKNGPDDDCSFDG